MKSKRFFNFIILSACFGTGIYLSTEPLYIPTALSVPKYLSHFPQYIAHKAIISGDFRGNSLPAIKEAISSHVDGIEVDVRSSKDNILFLYHADTLEESTNGSGKPEDYSWSELSRLSYHGENHTGLVKLDDFLKMAGSQKMIFLDIKSEGIWNNRLAKNIATLIAEHHLQDTVFVESFNPFFLISMRLTARDVLLVYDFTTNNEAYGEEIQSQFDKIPWALRQPWIQKQIRRIVRPDVLGPRFNIDRNILKNLTDNGYPVIVWTVDEAKIAQEMFTLGIQGVQTNNPLNLMNSLPVQTGVTYDAGGTGAHLYKIIHVKKINDIVDAIAEARGKKKSITVAGRRHSMGGQTLLDDSIQLNMLSFDKVQYNDKTQTITANAGATWKKIQHILDENHRSVPVMQSDNIFTIGGSVSVNAHGWQAGKPAIASTIVAMTVITPDGKIRKITKDNEPKLFSAVIGGYGMFGIIANVELQTVQNITVRLMAQYMSPDKFEEEFTQNVTHNPRAELAYGRLSVDKNYLFKEAGLFWYEKTSYQLPHANMQTESLVAFKRGIFRASQYADVGKKIRWSAEKLYMEKISRTDGMSRNYAMNTDIHILWPLYGNNKDILHEYFIPKGKLTFFINALRDNVIKNDMNILNVTLREVRRDTISSLPYAQKDVFGIVCLFSQQRSSEAEEKMRKFTEHLIDSAINLGGTFYLPYRLHYNREQLLKAYPDIHEWIRLKKKWDPDKILQSHFFNYIEKTLASSPS